MPSIADIKINFGDISSINECLKSRKNHRPSHHDIAYELLAKYNSIDKEHMSEVLNGVKAFHRRLGKLS